MTADDVVECVIAEFQKMCRGEQSAHVAVSRMHTAASKYSILKKVSAFDPELAVEIEAATQ